MTEPRTHAPTNPLTHSPNHPRTHSLTHPTTHEPIHSLTQPPKNGQVTISPPTLLQGDNKHDTNSQLTHMILCMSKMPGWTPDHSMILSLLLDVVTGTKEEIAMRQNHCRIHDSFYSSPQFNQANFTGSKSEGLDLPGSDEDYMYDINNKHNIEVIQSSDEYSGYNSNSIFVMCTENDPPGFVLSKACTSISIASISVSVI